MSSAEFAESKREAANIERSVSLPYHHHRNLLYCNDLGRAEGRREWRGRLPGRLSRWCFLRTNKFRSGNGWICKFYPTAISRA